MHSLLIDSPRIALCNVKSGQYHKKRISHCPTFKLDRVDNIGSSSQESSENIIRNRAVDNIQSLQELVWSSINTVTLLPCSSSMPTSKRLLSAWRIQWLASILLAARLTSRSLNHPAISKPIPKHLYDTSYLSLRPHLSRSFLCWSVSVLKSSISAMGFKKTTLRLMLSISRARSRMYGMVSSVLSRLNNTTRRTSLIQDVSCFVYPFPWEI